MNQNINETPDQDMEKLAEEIAEVLGVPQSALESDQEPTELPPAQSDDTDTDEDPCEGGGGGCL